MEQVVTVKGFRIYPAFLDRPQQEATASDLRHLIDQAPLFQPQTRRGQKLSVRMTSAGRFGWVSDRNGYRYERHHPGGGRWPAIPDCLFDVWRAVSNHDADPDSALINWYGPEARMGLHQDRDEADLTAPVIGISLGDDGLFRMGNVERGGPTQSHWLKSGDVVVMGGEARLAHHGVDRIRPGTSTLLRAPGRINVTLRVVS